MRGVNYGQKERTRMFRFVVRFVFDNMYWRYLVDLDTNKVFEK